MAGMPGRTIPPESWFARTPYADPTLAWRRAILRETLQAIAARPGHHTALARANLARWHRTATPPAGPRILVLPSDWGEATGQLTRDHGVAFAVLNMANAFVAGGGYVEGMAAQEENLFRRTDCHFHVPDTDLQPDGLSYRPELTRRIEGRDGRVYLDVAAPRVCVRGPEVPGRRAGYACLADDEVFPFFELRAAARDYRDGAPFDADDARRRIQAQLDTLAAAGLRHAVLGASGCGAFQNPPDRIAQLYRDELDRRAGAFDCIAFAVFHAGYGPDNFAVFERALATC